MLGEFLLSLLILLFYGHWQSSYFPPIHFLEGTASSIPSFVCIGDRYYDRLLLWYLTD